MRYYQKQSLFNNDLEFHLIISRADMHKIRLEDFDNLLLDECERSEKVSDKLLALETIVRRLEGKT